MKFISVGDLHEKSAKIWKELPEAREIVITSNGRPIALLAAINESNLEQSIAAFRQARAVESLIASQRRSPEQGLDSVSMEHIDAEIATVRKKRVQ